MRLRRDNVNMSYKWREIKLSESWEWEPPSRLYQSFADIGDTCHIRMGLGFGLPVHDLYALGWHLS